MALTHMLYQWAAENNKTIHALTVDHRLRDDSADEAELVAEWMKNFPNIKHVTLKCEWGEKPETAVMERARNERYGLMNAYCGQYNIRTLCIAHHADDQVETFFFRLAKGSGLDGLCGMKEWANFDDLKIFRPLLNYTHQYLIQYCESENLNWIEDPSNQNTDYARPRLRAALADEGLDSQRLVRTIERIGRGQEALEWMVCDVMEKAKEGDEYDWRCIQQYPLDIQIRVLQKLISQVGEVTHSYPPKLERIEEIVATIKPSKSATLHGCVLTLSKDGKTLAVKQA